MVTSYIESRREIHVNCTGSSKTVSDCIGLWRGLSWPSAFWELAYFCPSFHEEENALWTNLSQENFLEQLNMCSDFPQKVYILLFYGAFIILQNVGELQYIVISHEETGSKIRSGRFHMTAPLPWLLTCFTFEKCPQSCLGNVQSGHTIMTMQQSSHAKEPWVCKPHETGKKWDNGIPWPSLKMEMITSCFSH